MAPRTGSNKFKVFTLRIEGVNADNIPLEDIGAYLIDLSVIIGKEYTPRFHGIKRGSLLLSTKTPNEDEGSVKHRLSLVKTNDAPQDMVAAQIRISERLGVHRAKKAALLDSANNKVLEFPVIRPSVESYSIPRISKAGTLQGKIIRIGGRKDDVPVDIEDVDGHVYNCRATRDVASKLAKEMFYPTVRVSGEGYWVRDDAGWGVESFKIFDFELLDDDPLNVVVAELRETLEGLNDIEDPFGALEGIRSGVYQ